MDFGSCKPPRSPNINKVYPQNHKNLVCTRIFFNHQRVKRKKGPRRAYRKYITPDSYHQPRISPHLCLKIFFFLVQLYRPAERNKVWNVAKASSLKILFCQRLAFSNAKMGFLKCRGRQAGRPHIPKSTSRKKNTFHQASRLHRLL